MITMIPPMNKTDSIIITDLLIISHRAVPSNLHPHLQDPPARYGLRSHTLQADGPVSDPQPLPGRQGDEPQEHDNPGSQQARSQQLQPEQSAPSRGWISEETAAKAGVLGAGDQGQPAQLCEDAVRSEAGT